KEIEAADVVVVLDISDIGRLGDLQRAIKQSHSVACIDHHVSQGSLPEGPRLVAPEAAATAELVFDFACAVGWPLSRDAARALYVGLLTDTGAFRFANTNPRALRVAGALLERGGGPGASVRRRGTQAGGGSVARRVDRRRAATGARRSAPVSGEPLRELAARPQEGGHEVSLREVSPRPEPPEQIAPGQGPRDLGL